MVRSSGHHRKRSRSRSITPDHKRSKSSRDYDKDRPRRRSRSRDRLRRSRSRDRKKDKKIPESRVRSKPLKLKRRSRSRSRSRSKSKEKVTKKEEKKDSKEDEPFDPTNLDKVPGEDEEWVVTDVIEETGGDLEEEYDYEADEDDRYSRRSSSSHGSHPSSSQDAPNQQSEEIVESKEDNDKNVTSTNSEIENNTNDLIVTDEVTEDKEINYKTKSPEKENLKGAVSELKEISSRHKTNMKSISRKNEVDRHKRNYSFKRSYNNFKYSEDIERLLKDQLRQSMKFEKELHNLRIKNETARHKAELEVLKIQLDYWKGKA